jgi:hypothetical protein
MPKVVSRSILNSFKFYSLQLSNMPNMHVCCRRMEAPLPNPQAQTDLPPLQPPSPGPGATFRPPIEEVEFY